MYPKSIMEVLTVMNDPAIGFQFSREELVHNKQQFQALELKDVTINTNSRIQILVFNKRTKGAEIEKRQ